MVVVTGEWKCERTGNARVKKEWKISLKVLKISGKSMAVGCWFPPKFPNSGTLLCRGVWVSLGSDVLSGVAVDLSST